MLQTHGWDAPSKQESDSNPVPLKDSYVVATSSTEAKFYARVTCMKAAKYLPYVLEELDALREGSTPFSCRFTISDLRQRMKKE